MAHYIIIISVLQRGNLRPRSHNETSICRYYVVHSLNVSSRAGKTGGRQAGVFPKLMENQESHTLRIHGDLHRLSNSTRWLYEWEPGITKQQNRIKASYLPADKVHLPNTNLGCKYNCFHLRKYEEIKWFYGIMPRVDRFSRKVREVVIDQSMPHHFFLLYWVWGNYFKIGEAYFPT